MIPQYHDIIRARTDTDTAVILLHGILSAPQFFDFLLPEIPERFAVYGILLEGHGSSPQALAQASMTRWKDQIRELMQTLLPQYPRILIAAHSMGTLFALRLAAEYPAHIRHMLLLGVPLRVHLTLSGAGCSLLAACGVPSPEAKHTAMQQAYSIAPDRNPLHYAGWLPRYLELFDEIGAVNAMRMSVCVPCEVFQSAADELVSPEALPLLRGMTVVRLHVLRESTHFYYSPHDRQRILHAWRQIIRQTCHTGEIRPCK